MDSNRIKELQQLMKEVPFGNSAYQATHFNEKETPERKYRHCLLQVDRKIKALKECEFRRRRIDIDVLEIKEKLTSATGFEKDKLLIDLEEKEYNLESEIKLIEDAAIELCIYEKLLTDLPKFTREQFELSESEYWKQKLLNDARLEQLSTGTVSVGTLASLEATGLKFGRNEQGALAYKTEGEGGGNGILRIGQTN